MGDDKLHIARTESLFRDVNERIAETAQRFESEETGFVCECADPACTDRVEVPLDTYESVRSEPTRFVTVPGHELEQPLEEVVVRRGEFQVIEKVDRSLREHVSRFDPRAA
jgi:hypothetical protein